MSDWLGTASLIGAVAGFALAAYLMAGLLGIAN